jgi:hypothetical protein
MDVDEFMVFLETRPKEERWHLIEGTAVMMAPPSMADQRITRNFCELLNRAFAAQGLDLFAYITRSQFACRECSISSPSLT